MDNLDAYLNLSRQIPGWTRDEEAVALTRLAYQLSENAVIVEIGSFFGSGAVLLAGARKLRNSGEVHCVDPFDGSGDSFSAPHYNAIIGAFGARPLRDLFDENIRRANLTDWVRVHQGTAEAIAAS